MTPAGRFAGKVAVVTGGVSGIGLAAVRRLHHEGASVVVGDIDADGIRAVEDELGERAAGLRCDVTDEGDVERLVAAAVDRFGRLDLGFNVAGGGRGDAIVATSAADWRHTLDLSLTGAFHGVKHQARQMIAQGGGGAIVNVSSICGQLPIFGAAGYCSAKAGLDMLSRSAALELGEHGIRVNAVSPGYTATPLTARMGSVPEIRERYVEQTPLRRIGEVDDIAAALLFLASEEAAFVTGVNLLVDGGFTTTTHFDTRQFQSRFAPETSEKPMGRTPSS